MSRFSIYEIKKPTSDEIDNLNDQIFASVYAETALPFDEMVLSPDAKQELKCQPPRTIRNCLRAAIARAVLRKSFHRVESRDLRLQPIAMRIGF